MVRIRLEIGILLDGMQYNEYMAWGEAVEGMSRDDQTEALVSDYIEQFPLTVFVDREVWHSVDKHSFDTHILSIVIDPCIVSGDQLEAIADHEDMKAALAEVFGEGRDWQLSLTRLI